MIRLNNLANSVFAVNAAEFGGSQERADIVACGRLLMAERAGRDMNRIHVLREEKEDYTSRIDDVKYNEINDSLKRKLMLYCAKLAANQTGRTAPETYEDFLKQQRQYMGNSDFLRTLAGVVTEIVTPVLPAVTSGALDYLCETVYTPIGQTYAVQVESNDVLIFEDDSHGAARSKPAQRLYSRDITLNPRPVTAKASIKWYQMVGNNVDLGRFFNSISAGLYNKIMVLWNSAMAAGAANATFMPSGLSFAQYSTANFLSAVKKVKAVNNAYNSGVIAFGDIAALAQVLPSGVANAASVNLDAALAHLLGAEYARMGYLTGYCGANLMPVDQAILPGTQNTTVTEIFPTDVIYIASAGGYKPVYMAFEEGYPMDITLDPSETADMSIDIIVTASMEAKPVFGSKIAKIAI